MTQHLLVQRPTTAEINLGNLTHNIGELRRHLDGTPIMAIIKANAYGHGLIAVAHHLQALGITYLGVAFPEEGVALRRAGITIPILVLGGIYYAQIADYLNYDLDITVSSIDKLRQVEKTAAEHGKTAVVHLKIDTGMERVGVHSETCGPFIEAAVHSKHCLIKGIYSHLACADEPDSPMTTLQLERFLAALGHFDRLGVPMPIRHLANSGGILYFPDTHLDMVRPGLVMYGVYPSRTCPRPLAMRAVLSLKSQIVYFKVVAADRPVSYGATWAPPQATRVVTVPIGYGDGYRRALSGCGEVLIHGKRYPIVGRVCMDQFMVDIGKDSAFNGDEVVLIGQQGDALISAEEIAEHIDTIPYEILTGLNDRIPRLYV